MVVVELEKSGAHDVGALQLFEYVQWKHAVTGLEQIRRCIIYSFFARMPGDATVMVDDNVAGNAKKPRREFAAARIKAADSINGGQPRLLMQFLGNATSPRTRCKRKP